jgi:phosphoribosylformimino-5-aminoimidazole carboxamide ribotide isomerase
MQIIPAIDLSEGKCVRLRRGDMAQKTVYSDNPAEFALRWQQEGAQILHLVDLDGAISGSSQNLRAVEAIVAAVEIPVQLGGGLRASADVRRVFDLGVHWAIMGTSALADSDALTQAVTDFPGRIVAGIDARDGFVAVAGWVQDSQVSAIDLAVQVEKLGVARIIFTDIATDGMMQGPNVDSTRTLAETVQIPVIASGGVSTLEDVRAVCGLSQFGVIGMIIGRALYENGISLPEAIAIAGDQCADRQ